jgi:hypothetical protein
MVFAIAALLLHLGSASDTRIVTDIATVVTSATANPTDPGSLPSAAMPAKPAPNPADPATAGGVTTLSLAETTQNPQSFETLRLPDPAPAKPIRVIAAETTPPRKTWLMLSFAEHGAAAFDAYTTREAVNAGAREDNPLLRPFAHSPAIYAATQVGPTLFDYAARRMERSQYPFLRHSWWLPQSASAAISIFSGIHNSRATTLSYLNKHNIHSRNL